MEAKMVNIGILSDSARRIKQIKKDIHLIQQIEYLEEISQVDILIITQSSLSKLIGKLKEIQLNVDKQPVIILILNTRQKKHIEKVLKLGIRYYINMPYKKVELQYTVQKAIYDIRLLKNMKTIKRDFNRVFNETPNMAWFKDKNSRYIKANYKFLEHAGKEHLEVKGKDDHEVWDGQIGEMCRVYDQRVMEENAKVIFDEIIPGKNGYRQFHVHKIPRYNDEGVVCGTIGIAIDITDFKNSDMRYNIIINDIPIGICIKDCKGNIIDANKTFTDALNISLEELQSYNIKEMWPDAYSEYVEKEDQEVLRQKRTLKFDRDITHDNQRYILKVYKTPLLDISGENIGVVGIYSDITKEREAEEYAYKIAYTDYLTGLSNRRGLYNYVQENATQNISVMFLDLDNFKELNDSHGHYYGDQALIKVANELRVMSSEAFVARIGGDEFIVVYQGDKESPLLREKAEQIIVNIKNVFKENDKMSRISVSIGVVKGDLKKDTIETLLAKGDLALYKAKEQGKDRYVFYIDAFETERRFNIEIARAIQNSINNKEINIHYQPYFSTGKTINDIKLKGFEALLRWDNPRYKHVPIIDIIKLIEQGGMIHQVGEYVLEEAMKFCKYINQNSLEPLVVAINISALQIMESQFVSKFKSIMEKVDVDPCLISLELTETVLLNNIEENVKKIESLRDMGIRIALDDFGTGYSSLSYLSKLPISTMKIDRSFIQEIRNSQENEKLVKLMIDTAHLLHIQVIAEGVEEKETLEILRSLGSDMIQGYLFSSPVPKEAAYQIIQKNNVMI